MSENATLSVSGQDTIPQPPQDIAQHLREFEGRVTEILGGIVARVEGLQRQLNGAALALSGNADRTADGDSGSLPVAGMSAQAEREINARFGDGAPLESQCPAETNPPAQDKPVSAAPAEGVNPLALPVAATEDSVPAASSDMPLGPHTHAVEHRRLQSSQVYGNVVS